MKRKKLSNTERQKIYDKCKGHCAYCGCELEYRDMQVDHVIPLRRGGSDDVDNMLPACRSCNHYKATLTADEYKEYVSRIPDRLHRDSIPYQVGERFGIIRSNRDARFYFEKLLPERREGE